MLRAGLVSVFLLMLVACSETDTEYSLQLIVSEQHSFDGRSLTTFGVVRDYDDPKHYWIEDEQLNRVALEPHSSVAGFVGREVVVTGRFMLNEHGGRLLKVREIDVLEHTD